MPTLAPLWLALTLLGAIPPMSAEEKAQLATADESVAYFDQGALYPLLFNAAKWTPGDEAGAAVPDFEALLRAPAEQRGELLLIEAEYLDTSPTLKLARPGPWEPKVRRWLLRPRQAPGVIIAVMLVNPPSKPERGQWYRMPARFYRLVHDTRQRAKQTELPLLVGHGAVKMASPTGGRNGLGGGLENLPLLSGDGGENSGSAGASPTGAEGGSATGGATGGSSGGEVVRPWALVVVLVIGIGSLVFLARRVLALRSGWTSRAARERERERLEAEQHRREEFEDQGPPLPHDPVEAMRELERRHQRDLDEAFERVRQQQAEREHGTTPRPSESPPTDRLAKD